MSRKVKHRTASGKPVPLVGAAGGDSLSSRAEAALGASRYKEAIELYKDLLKGERRPDWLDQLAAAYAGRARDLVAKGMVKEALALWHTRADRCGKPVCEGPYVEWLLLAGERDEALGLLAKARAQLSDETIARLETRLAAAVLVAPDSALAQLDADSALMRHRVSAREALAACGRGDFGAMGAHLEAIPFRSPFRDLRPILKALALLTTDPRAAAAILDRATADGPFEPLAAAARAALLPDGRWLAALSRLDAEGQQLVLDLKGCPSERRALLLELARLGEAPSAAALFDVLVRYRRHLPEGAAAMLCRRLLPHASDRLRSYVGCFGAMPFVEEAHVLALAAEIRGRRQEAEHYWLDAVDAFGAAAPVDTLRAALVLRHLADNLGHRNPDGTLDDEALDWLARSIELDPDDRESYLKLVREWRGRSDLKRARTYLDAALGRFPKDAQVLSEAVETALASGAFKKAVDLAKRVLELDPINPGVRRVVGHAHLSHARKQIRSRHDVAARKELDLATEWLRTAQDRGSLKLLRGLVSNQPDESDALLREAVAELGGPLVGGFQLALEAKRLGQEPQGLLRRAHVDLTVTPSTNQVVALAHALDAARDPDQTLHAALKPLRGMLERAARGAQYAESECLLVCEALYRRNERDLVRTFAAAALKRWPGRPVFVYLKAAAAYSAKPWTMPERDAMALEDALEEAQRQGDQRTKLRILDLLSALDAGYLPADDGFDDFRGNIRDELEMILESGGPDCLLDMARKQLGPQVYEDLRRELGGNKQQFARRLIDLLSAAVALPFPPPIADPKAPARPAPKPKRREPAPDIQRDLFDD